MPGPFFITCFIDKKCFRASAIVAGLFFYIVYPAATAVARQETQRDHFAQQLEAIRQQLKIPGMAVALQRDDTVLLAEGFGYADLDKHIKVTPQTAFAVASVGKTFTSTLVMQLVEAGKLRLDDRVSQYGVYPGNPDITVR